MLKIDEILLLHLTRNAPTFLSMDNKLTQNENFSQFAMFDYFDWLTVERNDQLDYSECLGLTSARPSRVPLSSSQYLALATLQGQPKSSNNSLAWRVGDPFFCVDGGEFPFLSTIVVNVLPNFSDGGVSAAEKDVKAFLLHCVHQLYEQVNLTCRKLCTPEEEESPQPELKAIYQVYHCINSGNFCVAIRSRVPELAYHVSMQIRAAKLNETMLYGFPSLDCHTFSFLGTYCPAETEAWTYSPAENVRKMSSSKVAMRLSVTNQVRNELVQNHSGSLVDEAICGLLGRYDITLHMRLEEFWQLYPWICAHKLGVNFSYRADQHVSAPLVVILRKALEDQGAQCINVRVLLDLTGSAAPSDDGVRQQERQERVRRENAEVAKRLQEMEQLVNMLPACQLEYLECICLLKDLWDSYNSLRYQDDSFINGNILLSQICTLIEINNNYIRSTADKPVYRYCYDDLLFSLRSAVDSISHFQKLILSINQQSLQSPNYEVQMHADLEKYVVAYTEFCRRFLTEHLSADRFESENLKSRQQKICPIITVNSVHKGIRARQLFLLPYYVIEGQSLYVTNDYPECVLLSIEMPGIGSFGDIYKIIPLICHELFHNFRIIDRDKRNDALEKFVLHRIAQYVVRRWVGKTGEKNNYSFFGVLEDKLFVDKLSDQLDAAYQKRCVKVHGTANIDVLTSNILAFLMDDVFTHRDKDEFQKPMGSPQQISGLLEQLCRLALDALDGEKLNWIDDYEEIRQKLKQEGNLKELQNPIIELSRELIRATIGGHIAFVMEASIELLELAGDKESEIRDHLEFIWDDVGAADKGLLPATQVDLWIREIDKRRSAVNKVVKNMLVTSDELSLAAKALDYSILELCYAIKDASHLGKLICEFKYQQNQSSKEQRNLLIKGYRDSIRREIQAYHDNQDNNWIIYSAPQIQEILVPLGVDLMDDDSFGDGLRQVLLGCSQKDIESTVTENTTLYREAFADLGMCISLNLTTFGYIRVLSGVFENLQETPSNMKLERILLVSRILLSRGDMDENLKKLKGDSRSYLESVAALVKKCDESEWEDCYKQLDALLRNDNEAYGVPAYLYTIEQIKKWCGNDPNYQILYAQLKSLWNTIHLVNYIEKNQIVSECHPLLDHFTLLDKSISNIWMDKRNFLLDCDIMQRVGNAYNDPKHTDYSMSGYRALKDTLEFVLHDYYLGWLTYGKNFCGSSDLDDWLHGLVEGRMRDEHTHP